MLFGCLCACRFFISVHARGGWCWWWLLLSSTEEGLHAKVAVAWCTGRTGTGTVSGHETICLNACHAARSTWDGRVVDRVAQEKGTVCSLAVPTGMLPAFHSLHLVERSKHAYTSTDLPLAVRITPGKYLHSGSHSIELV